MKPMIVGMCAHVDAGKTTLSEALLYQSGKIKSLGRVDHGTTVLDFEPLERQRGITITAKEAFFTWRDRDITLLDTPGHRDFSAALEHTFSVLDAAVLVISATDPQHPYSEQIFHHLRKEQIPTIIFINKMDIGPYSHREYMEMISRLVKAPCVDFNQASNKREEELALCSDALLETYLEKGTITTDEIAAAISRLEVIPVFFGSAREQVGIRELLDAFSELIMPPTYGSTFAARVYKISHDESGQRWTHLKITGGELAVKQRIKTEKVDQIRRYHGSTYENCSHLPAGYVAAIKGLHQVIAGAGLGGETIGSPSLLSAALTYRVLSEEGLDDLTLMEKLRPLGDEDPSLRLHYDSFAKEVQLSLRGQVQAEVLINMIQNRFQLSVSFTPGRIAYRESITAPIEGVGHIERLKHYAEVHVLLEPLRRNAGIQVMSLCPSSMLEESRQVMLIAHLRDHLPPGVMSGSPLTDMCITLIGIKTHAKHTDAQDLREAAERAVRQGLKMGHCELLEPYISYRLCCDDSCVGQAIYDLEQRGASYEISAIVEGQRVINGSGPYRNLSHYEQNVHTYTKGQGVFFISDDGYHTVKEPRSLCDEIGYDWAQDRDYPCGATIFQQGIVSAIPYDQVYEHMDLALQAKLPQASSHVVHRQITISDEEWQRVTDRLHVQRKQWKPRRSGGDQSDITVSSTPKAKQEQCLIVDGYNMIYDWPNLKDLMERDADAARTGLLAILGNYQGYWNHTIIVVFDAYRTMATKEHIVRDHHLYIVYTKSAQTADAYIEKTTHRLASEMTVSVATSDAAEQNIILAQGAMRISARELYERIQQVHQQAMTQQHYQPQFRHMALEDLRHLNETEED